MIRNVHCYEIRQIIADAIKPIIEAYRLKKENHFFSEYNVEPTEDEIDEFILSSLYFDDWIKDFLLSGNGYWLLDDEDVEGYKSNLILWIENNTKK